MRSLWVDSVANAEESAPTTVAAPAPVANHQNSRPTRSSYVPPHLRGRSPDSLAPAPAPAGIQPSGPVPPTGGYAAAVGGTRWAAPPGAVSSGVGVTRQSAGGGGRGGGCGGAGWNSRPFLLWPQMLTSRVRPTQASTL
ncbi:hypothetical protein QYE76_000945 [Lolium multiflorum]|uniref:Uncharacterized protein n=1 Tax=Lolium multiflorum TaxID=4521 RepID=A0AAD8RJR1_LOLMU|nr:hypothetical protein QYE76_000945 [Lolium multiflorum]